MSRLELKGVSKRYNVRGSGTMLALDNVDVTVALGPYGGAGRPVGLG